jgi:hypothetical protein
LTTLESTHSQFLAGDGAIVATFEPALTAEQAEELAAIVREPGSADELALLLEAVADDWGLYLVIDRV